MTRDEGGGGGGGSAATVIAVNTSGSQPSDDAVPADGSKEAGDVQFLQVSRQHPRASRSSSGRRLRLGRTLSFGKRGGGTWPKRDFGILFRRLSSRSSNHSRRPQNRSSSAVAAAAGSASATRASMSMPPAAAAAGKGKKLGHRRVQTGGEVTYKKFETTQLMGSIQLGIQQSVGSLANQPDRDLLIKDFDPIETVAFTKDGNLEKTPAHNYSEFRFRTYAGFAFKKYRQIFEIDESDFLASLCSVPMVELSNPGASGSIFYITQDDAFICKTVMRKEADFLQKLLPAYYMNLNQNPRTLLPKFFGLYCYSCNAKNVRIIVMNNLLPSALKMHHRFDLKGSTYKRKASTAERDKSSPTFKDLDFLEMYPEGILLQPELYDNLLNSIQRDCRVLESFKIMDYSLLIGIHNLDQAAKEAAEAMAAAESGSDDGSSGAGLRKPPLKPQQSVVGPCSLERTGSITYREGRPAIAHSTALESINMVEVESGNVLLQQSGVAAAADTTSLGSAAGSAYSEEGAGEGEEAQDTSVKNVWGGIPAKNHRGDNLLLFIGVIDILQSYGMLKKAEHYWKSLVHDGDTVSVHRPSFYAKRFQSFMKDKVFKMLPSPLRPGPSFRRSQFRRTMSRTEADVTQAATLANAAALAVSQHQSDLQPAGSPLAVGATVSQAVVEAHPVNELDGKGGAPLRGIQDPSSVTVITIGEGGAGAASPTSPVNLPPVLQDRPRASISQQGQTQQPQQLQQQHPPLQARSSGGPRSPAAASSSSTGGTLSAHRPDVADVISTPASPEPRPGSSTGHDDRLETGSVITMTSDERVQIYVPSPQTTPYNTIQSGSSVRASFPPALTSETAAVAAATGGGHIARVGILAGNDSSRAVTPIKAPASAAATAGASTTVAASDIEASLEMVRISIRSDRVGGGSTSSASTASSAAAAVRAHLTNDAGGGGPVSLSDITLTEDEIKAREEEEEEETPTD